MDTLSADHTGPLAFLFTDIEGSTRKWEQHPQAMKIALELHDEILAQEIRCAGGKVFKTVGDAFCAVFGTPEGAVTAAESIQLRISKANWGETGELKVRCAVHCGPAIERDNDYFGPTLNRVARILSTGHGGQILLSQAAAQGLECVRSSLSDLGEHRLKDLERPERISQLNVCGLEQKFQPLKSLSEFRHNLPQYHTSFIGRQSEITRIRELLEGNGIVTLKGFGGCGKTRLALQTAADLLDCFSDGVWLLSLNTLSTGQEITDQLAAVLDVSVPRGQQPLDFIVRFLRQRKLLLIFDNCEHLIDDAAGIIASVAAGAPGVRLIATSRESLRIDGESVIEIPPFATSDQACVGPPESVLLFLSRMRQPQPATDQDLKLIAGICRRLDGIPLAIELAAGLTFSLPLPVIAERLDQRFSLLAAGKRGAPLQHKTLRAAIDWSYDRLAADEQRLLRLVSVLKWEWTIESCEKIAAVSGFDRASFLQGHSSLVEKSLIMPREEYSRFYLLETVREYAGELLRESGEQAHAFDMTAHFYLDLAEKTSSSLFGDHFRAMEIFTGEHMNLSAVCDGLEAEGDAEHTAILARIICAMYEYWQAASLDGEADARFKRILTKKKLLAKEKLAWVLANRARNLNSLGFYEQAENAALEAYNLASGCNDQAAAWAKLTHGVSLVYRGRHADALEQYVVSRELFEKTDDRLGLASVIGNIGGVYIETGRLNEAEPMLVQAGELYRQAGDFRRLAYVMANIGQIFMLRDELEKASLQFRDTIAHLEKHGWSCFVDLGYTQLAVIATHKGDHQSALSYSLSALKAVLRTQTLGVCARCLTETAEIMFRVHRESDAAVLLGAAATVEELLNTTAPQVFFERCLERFAPEDKPCSVEVRSAFESGRELRLSDILHFLESVGL
ncbi:MAG: adenylate/guanylate cyclase domain-containing protein [Candidatus Wallbacteria bacterium]|nr:adenylate/guanylate cyclase domain-containing protein [Candidatus Wallbacteria bacterium]